MLSDGTIVIPAYGRTYTTATKAREDWYAGKDFKIPHGPYCSKRDFPADERIELFYKKGCYTFVNGIS